MRKTVKSFQTLSTWIQNWLFAYKNFAEGNWVCFFSQAQQQFSVSPEWCNRWQRRAGGGSLSWSAALSELQLRKSIKVQQKILELLTLTWRQRACLEEKCDLFTTLQPKSSYLQRTRMHKVGFCLKTWMIYIFFFSLTLLVIFWHVTV